MVFTSPVFLFGFFPITLTVYFLINPKLRNAWLCMMSFVFYAWGGLSYAIIIFISTVANYAFGLLLHRLEGSPNARKAVLVFSVCYNLGVLGFFKYFNFFLDNVVAAIQLLSPGFSLSAPLIPLPIGISFFTFQIMSYIIDVYKNQVEYQKNIINLGLYMMLFPQVLAGPIVRYKDLEKEIISRKITLDGFRAGMERFIIGLAKKMLLANSMGELANGAFDSPEMLNMPMAWLGIIGYALQIYYDFSAYSDMAIGLGKMFGFHFLENFNYPYISTSIQEFWRRWHISLSTWFRDYLYIPLGGNRVGNKRTYLNLIIVFFATGLWHGASWNFIVWGLYHGFFLIVERIGLGGALKRIPKYITHAYTILAVLAGWVFFRAATLKDAVFYLSSMFNFNFSGGARIFLLLDNWKIITLTAALLFVTPVFNKIKRKLKLTDSENALAINRAQTIYQVFLALAFIISAAFATGSSFNPFIYFRF